jgi:hypothetical protein
MTLMIRRVMGRDASTDTGGRCKIPRIAEAAMPKHKLNAQALVYPVSLVLVVVIGHYWFHWSDIVVGIILVLLIGDHELEKVTGKLDTILEEVTDRLDAITELVTIPEVEDHKSWSPSGQPWTATRTVEVILSADLSRYI